MRCRRWVRRACLLLPLSLLAQGCAVGGSGGAAGGVGPAERSGGPPVGRDVVDRLEYPPLRFTPLRPERFTLSNGVPVFFLRDASLPLVSVFVDMKGGHVYLPREDFAASSALLPLMRNGGTVSRSPDTVDEIVESNALGLSTSDDGERMVVGVNSLRRQMGLALDLWADLLLHPRFDPAAVERWRLEELSAIGRDHDFPGTLAVLEFNHLLYGDHPLGWIMSEADLAPDLVTPPRLSEIHGRVVCPQTAVIGATGDVTREELQEALERVLKEWRPCTRGLDAPPPLELHADPVTYVIPSSLSQSTIVVGQPGGVLLQDDADYFASRVANWVIGESGLTSRLATRLRTDAGLAYSAASIWGASRDHARIFGAITHTRSDRTLDALRMMTETIDSVRVDPPDEAEIELARRDLVNGFVFGFDDPLQVVARQVRFLALGLPPDWPDRYVRGVRAVERRDVGRVLRKYLDPERFTTLILGDTAHFDLDRVRPYRIVEAPRIGRR